MRIDNTDNNNTNTNTNNPPLDQEVNWQGDEEFLARQRDMDRIDRVREQYRNISLTDLMQDVQQQLSNLQPNETQRRNELLQQINELRRVWRILHL